MVVFDLGRKPVGILIPPEVEFRQTRRHALGRQQHKLLRVISDNLAQSLANSLVGVPPWVPDLGPPEGGPTFRSAGCLACSRAASAAGPARLEKS